jgi:S1-C subfamily serine protease
MRVGDLIVAMNGSEVTSVDDLYRLLAEWPVGQRITLTVIRGQEREEMELLPTEAPFSE